MTTKLSPQERIELFALEQNNNAVPALITKAARVLECTFPHKDCADLETLFAFVRYLDTTPEYRAHFAGAIKAIRPNACIVAFSKAKKALLQCLAKRYPNEVSSEITVDEEKEEEKNEMKVKYTLVGGKGVIQEGTCGVEELDKLVEDMKIKHN